MDKWLLLFFYWKVLLATRKANEGVRISHLDPETRMNSRDEFRQGTNIMMRAMRGVGVWQAVLFNQGWRVLVQVQQCPKKREFSARRGSRTRRRGTVMPLRGYLLKNNVAVLLCIVPSLSLFRPCFDLFCFDLRQAPHSLSVGFAKNLCSRSQHVIRARRSKHVVQKKSINHWVKRLLLSKERSGKIKSQGWYPLRNSSNTLPKSPDNMKH